MKIGGLIMSGVVGWSVGTMVATLITHLVTGTTTGDILIQNIAPIMPTVSACSFALLTLRTILA